MKKIGIAIHGGAGTILKSAMTDEKEKQYTEGLNNSLITGWRILEQGGSALDAVTASVIELENNPLFNAGKGSVYTNDEKHEMDATIMDGKNLEAGAVCGVTNVKNPILLARAVMEKSEFVMMSTKGADEFAKLNNIEFASDEYFHTEHRYKQLQKAKESGKAFLDHTLEKDMKKGTVGAVAVDANGNLASATSTGGMTNKKYGRIGDTAIIGAGTYADNKTCAVSCTGTGEYFMRTVAAYRVAALMEYKKLSLKEAADEYIFKILTGIDGDGGLIAIDTDCNIVMPFNSEGMYRGFVKTGQEVEIKIYK
ncbi:MAG TPA: isoaspartyl peptidase/L-asparaginase [Ignavibacteria bacterium]|nr:isoaspartyl peptidase/L-asparaginase [Ignavibacteria bacterium]